MRLVIPLLDAPAPTNEGARLFDADRTGGSWSASSAITSVAVTWRRDASASIRSRTSLDTSMFAIGAAYLGVAERSSTLVSSRSRCASTFRSSSDHSRNSINVSCPTWSP